MLRNRLPRSYVVLLNQAVEVASTRAHHKETRAGGCHLCIQQAEHRCGGTQTNTPSKRAVGLLEAPVQQNVNYTTLSVMSRWGPSFEVKMADALRLNADNNA